MLSFFPRGVLDEILNLIESVSEEFPSYSYIAVEMCIAVTMGIGYGEGMQIPVYFLEGCWA